ncbi:TIGR03808 family TAT-translocated repetitive protein [Salinarimonas ramus]|uniref:Tat protein n=1 Tax=Salinarimonas ramus TaxID=690164 RepID=A0A917Q4L5_9HYPH|nr:TIGR03808 family TAT-translocated repetitive protein [Salinarimonas ramus]GGK22230.1 Tat protein [Salinarimonas ramus]
MASPLDPSTPPLPPRPDRRTILGAALAGSALVAGGSAYAAAISAESFGVRGDGSERTGALQQALDAAAAAGRPLALAPGDYPVTGLRLPAGGVLVGPRSARLRQASGGPAVSASGVGAARVVGMTIEGLGAGVGDAPLLSAVDVGDLLVEDVAFAGAPGPAIRLERSGGRVRGCVVAGARVGLFSLDATGLAVAENTITDCLDNGIQIWRSQKGTDGAQVIANRVARIRAASGGTGENGNGINVFRAGGVLVADNVISACDFSAVRNNGGDGIQIVSNRAQDCGEVALFTEFGFEGAVIASNLVDGAAHGIVSTNLNEGGRMAAITGNVVRNLFRRPAVEGGQEARSYGIFAEADAAISGNVIDGVPDEGLRLGWGPYLRNVAATGNVLRECGVGIVVSVVEGVGPVLIASNLITGARRAAILGHRWDETATGDLAREGADAWAHLTIASNAVG